MNAILDRSQFAFMYLKSDFNEKYANMFFFLPDETQNRVVRRVRAGPAGVGDPLHQRVRTGVISIPLPER